MKASEDLRSDGSTTDTEVAAEDLPTLMASPSRRGRLFVVVGGGKTGMDVAAWLGAQKQPEDEIALITGRPKAFLRRDAVFPPKSSVTDEHRTLVSESGFVLLQLPRRARR